ncbi:carboxypeptidase-like regulatory domain-containing protein [Reichenbachiella carrageenanivorans]|uniref:Carboxypeptidase-like regulatory domain-containing protein n=1 Tax=Reichenbachiella carrageenanivorans TaxID=2979869 RepID=A0ABY6D0H0_9BACT|nr:TonB-dependent receptor [Reichenbachiella carrageenanivorans]UXX79125.1 carboxypeptidase-like regulatory domain-containing protein [Reichenbachiella carrageenanivorans]
MAKSQNSSVRGVVLDSNNEPVPGISIRLNDTGIGAATNVNGIFSIKELKAGTHTFHISGIGYQKQSKSHTLRAGQELEVTIQLQEDTKEMDEVFVYGKSESTLLKQKGFAVNAIEAKDLELQSIQVNDVLDQTAGVRIRQAGGLGSRVRYNINGLSGSSIKIFIDGIPIDNYGSSYSLNSIPTSAIKRIEVYKGVVPAEFGGDAMGGAINVVTKQSSKNTLNVSYSYGSFNTHQASINGAFRTENSGLTSKVSTFYNYSDNSYKVWGDNVYVVDDRGKDQHVTTKRFHDSYESKGIKFDLGFTDVKWADQAFIGVLVSDMRKDIQHATTMEIVYGNRWVGQSTNMIQATYIKKDLLTSGLDVNFFASYSKLHRNLVDTVDYMYNWLGERTVNPNTGDYYRWLGGGEGGDSTLNKDNEEKYTARLNVAYQLGKKSRLSANILSTHFTRRSHDALDPQLLQDLTDSRMLWKNLLGVSWDYQAFGERLKSSLFYKFYAQDVEMNEPTQDNSNNIVINSYDAQSNNSGYGLALSYELWPNTILLASGENTLRMPNSRELFGDVSDNVESASSALKPERSVNFNLGFNLGPYRFSGHAVSLNSNVFYRRIQDRIMPGVPDQQDETFTYVNVSSVLSSGIDIELGYSYTDTWTWKTGFSLANPRFNTEFDANGSPYLYYKDRLRNEPYLTANSNLRYSKKDLIQQNAHFSAYYNVGYVHEFYKNWPGIGGAGKDIIPSQTVHDLGVSYTFPSKKITLSCDAKNIFNEQVFDNWALQKPGRAFYGKFTYNIF